MKEVKCLPLECWYWLYSVVASIASSVFFFLWADSSSSVLPKKSWAKFAKYQRRYFARPYFGERCIKNEHILFGFKYI